MSDFTLIGEQLTPVNEPVGETTPPVGEPSSGTSEYLEPINIPTYDNSNPTHLLITVANNKWTSANLNNPSYKHFYVEPGNYSSTIITLTADGTSSDRRSISLQGGGDTHPASLAEGSQANIRIKFNGASYWDIDRMSNINQTGTTDVTWFSGGSSYNVINRFHYKNFYSGIIIGASLTTPNDYNTIQNSYLNGMTDAGRESDNPGIAFANNSLSGLRTVGTKIINNDIKNTNDGIQLIRSFSKPKDVGFDGTIIDSNRIWVDNTLYYDNRIGSGGVLDSNGMYALSENAIDLKAGSQDSSNPIIMTNNIMWGFRKNAKDGDPGSVMGLMYGVTNVHIENNIFFDAERGLAINDQGGESWAAQDVLIKNNIFYQTNKTLGDPYCNYTYVSDSIHWEYNSFIDTSGGYGIIFMTSTGTTSYDNNLAINAGNMRHYSGDLTASNNYYYNTTNTINGAGDIRETSASNMTDFSFEYDRFTMSIKSKTLAGIISTTYSPHSGVAGSSIIQGDL